MLWKCCTQYASKFGKLSSGHITGKGQFSFQSQRKVVPKNVQITVRLYSFYIPARLSWRICMWKSSLQWMLTLKGLRAKVCLLSICPAIHISMYTHTHTHTHTHARTFKLWLLSGPGNNISKTMSIPKYHPPQRIQGFLEYCLWKTVQYWKKFGGFERLDI